MGKQAIREKLNTCSNLLAEKKLRESTFEDIIKPSMDLLDHVHAAIERGDLDLPPLVDDELDISKMLDTSENDLSTVDGTLTEAAKEKAQKALQEKERSYTQIIQDYIAQGGTGNYEEWRAWIETQPDAVKARVLNRNNFRKNYELLAPSNAAAAAPATGEDGEVVSGATAPAYEPSENLRNLISLCHADQDFVETAEVTVTDKYDTIELLLRRVVRGKSAKRYYILAGDAGIGKTYTVAKILREEGKADDIDKITYTGSIGRSVTSIATFLWLHRNDEILVLDDCDSFLRKGGNPDVVNILKGCMEAGTGYRVGIAANIAARITKDLGLGKKNKAESTVSDKVRALLEGEVAEDENLDDEELLDDEEVEKLLDTDDAVPTSWTFNSRMVIISNLHESQIEEPLWSRCDHFDLHLTQEEYLIRLAMILDGMDVGQKDGLCTPEEAQEAKALVLSVMQAVIEAGNHGVKFYGKFIQLTDHLEFRIVKDLVNTWLAMLEREMELHPNVSRDEAKKKIMQKWVRVGVIPRMSARKVL